MLTILKMYLTLMPLIFSGVANMVFCKSTLAAWANYPIDGGRFLADGKPLFGANKTWKGFLGMIIFTSFFQVFWLGLLSFSSSSGKLTFYEKDYSSLEHAMIGALLGLIYVVCELPNSYLKRRLSIAPGKEAGNSWSWVFIWIDQIDSLLGCIALLALFTRMTLPLYFSYILLGGVTHLLINRGLYFFKLRKNRY